MIANQQENAMTNVSKVSLAIAAAAVSVGFAISPSSPARADMLDKCQQGSSRAKVEGCCETYVRKHGEPIWFQERASSSCSNAVACYYDGKREREICGIHIPLNNSQGSGGREETKFELAY
jgi:hypothetical protein